MRRATDGVPITAIKHFAKVLGKKIGICTLAWVAIYFLSGPLRVPGSVLSVFSLLVGCLAGGVMGWWMAEDAVQDSGFSGLVLWAVLVAAQLLAILPVEWIFGLIMRRSMEFGGYMLVLSAIVMGLATSVWRASADD